MSTIPVERLNAALEGRYHIERELGEGGMATVFLADDIKHERKVALKVLKPELAAVVGAERFLSEIKVTANLQHPNILPLFDSGEADSFLFYVMPYVEGESLRDRLNREQQLHVDEAVKIATDLAEALDHAHRQKVVHRDIKPANILLRDGRPLIADFGIALAVGAAGGTRLTETGLSVGTPYYMSPEQATGDQVVGPASDIYALACVLYEMLVGEPPFPGATAQAVLGKIIAGEPVSATKQRPSIPPNIDAAVRCALEKLPADRFSDAQDFAGALVDVHFRHGEAVVGATGAGAGRWKRLTLATTAVAVLSTIGLAWSLSRPAPVRPVERFESPFWDGQGPIRFSPASYTISPDGSMVVYRGPPEGTGGGFQLWVRRWDDLDARPVRGTGASRVPSVSPDGRELAFQQGAEIKVLACEGGPIRTLTTGQDPHWGLDGYIYASVAEGTVRVPGSGGPADAVTRLADGDRFHVITDLLPGGKTALLYVLTGDQELETLAVDLATGELTRLMFGASPRYASSGHLLVWVDGTIMVAPFDPKTVELLGPAVALMDGVASFHMSQAGELVYLTGAGGGGGEDTELVWITRSGAVTRLQDGWAFNRGGGNYGWALSPDGTKVAVRIRTDGNSDIWIKDLPDGPLRRLTFDEGEQREPWWSPDGQTVMYSSGVLGDRNIWSRSADGTGTATLVHDDEHSFAQGTWSPDGEWLVYRTAHLAPDEGLRDIFAIRPRVDTVSTPLLTSEYQEHAPAVSPDGRWLAYTSDETGRDEVFVRPFPDVESGKHQVTTEGGIAPLWADNGRELFYVKGNALVAASIELDGGFRLLGQETLFSIPARVISDNGSVNFYDVAPGAARFLMGRGYQAGVGEDERPKMILVQNFSEELKARVPR